MPRHRPLKIPEADPAAPAGTTTARAALIDDTRARPAARTGMLRVCPAMPAIPIIPSLLRALGRLSARFPGRPASPDGVNLVGYAQGGLGLGENLRRFALAAHQEGLAFSLVDFAENLGDRAQDPRLSHWLRRDNPYPVNLMFINADQMATARAHFGPRFFERRRTIGFWFWELAHFPDDWLPAFDLVDEIWVASRFIESTLRPLTRKPIHRVALPVEVSLSRRFERAAFDLPDQRFAFLFSFDFHSFAARKNPIGTIDAFRRAFPRGDEPVLLVVKSINGHRAPELLAQIQACAAQDPRIRLIDRFLDAEQAMGLLSVVDCYVSLHRAEGFGLGMAEAMALGKPVIATDYSGNTDFTTADNSCLVPAPLVPVQAHEYPFGAGQVWADPDLDAAAEHMRRLVDDPAHAQRIGQAGARFIRAHHDNAACVASMREALRQG